VIRASVMTVVIVVVRNERLVSLYDNLYHADFNIRYWWYKKFLC
jgi:hypothetical protein